jgi:catechol-2,3-dioxygenase
MYQTTLGHAHLCVRNLKRSVTFYKKYLGLRLREIAAETAFMTGSGAHHELALWELGMKASG